MPVLLGVDREKSSLEMFAGKARVPTTLDSATARDENATMVTKTRDVGWMLDGSAFY